MPCNFRNFFHILVLIVSWFRGYKSAYIMLCPLGHLQFIAYKKSVWCHICSVYVY